MVGRPATKSEFMANYGNPERRAGDDGSDAGVTRVAGQHGQQEIVGWTSCGCAPPTLAGTGTLVVPRLHGSGPGPPGSATTDEAEMKNRVCARRRPDSIEAAGSPAPGGVLAAFLDCLRPTLGMSRASSFNLFTGPQPLPRTATSRDRSIIHETCRRGNRVHS
jgi:hypothetical protein